MKALQIERPEHWRQIEIPEPAAPGPGEALVRVDRVGICGTDYAGYLGKMPFFNYPRIPGHELGVEVLEVGKDVSHVRAGDRCSVEPYINCGVCDPCRRGFSNCCESLKVLGVMMDGGLTERLTVPARKLHPANALTPDQCALVETLAIGCHAVGRSGAEPAEQVLVIGAGPIGLAVLEFVKLAGARPIVMDKNSARLDFCRNTMRVERTVHSTGDATETEQIRAAAGGRFPEVVIDATGSSESMSQCLAYCGHAGRVVYVGITQKDLVFPHAPVMHRRELTLLASRNALPAEFTRIIQLIESGQLDTRSWISHRSSFDTLAADFPAFTTPETGVIKAIVAIN